MPRLITAVAPPTFRRPLARLVAPSSALGDLRPVGHKSAAATAPSAAKGRLKLGADATAPSAARGRLRIKADATAPSAASGAIKSVSPAGYLKARRIIVPHGNVQGGADLPSFPFCVQLSGAWLKWVGNDATNGRVQSPNGYDIRFELPDGTKLDHDLELWDGAAGQLVAWVRIPVLSASADTTVWLRYGKASQATAEENPTGTWRDYLAVWHLPNGVDRTGNGRDLTLTSVGTGALIGQAGAFDGAASVGVSAPATWLDGSSAITVQCRVKAASAPASGTFLAIRKTDDESSTRDLTFGFRTLGLAAGAASAANTITATVRTAAGEAIADGPADCQTTNPVGAAFTWAASQAPIIYLAGSPAAPSGSVAQAGSATLDGQKIVVGMPAVTNPAASFKFGGLLDELRIANAVLSAGRIATEEACITDPAAFYGIGDEEDAGGASSVVALPVAATGTAGTAGTIDVAAAAFVPPGVPSPTVSSAGPATDGGAVTVTAANKAGYTPAAQGAQRFPFTLLSQLKASTSMCLVAVGPSLGGGSSTWSDPNLAVAGGGTKTAVPVGSAAALTAALKGFNGVSGSPNYRSSTHYILFTANLTADFTIAEQAGKTRNLGSQADPLVLMAGTVGAKAAGTVGWSGCQCTVLAQWIWLYQIKSTRPLVNVSDPPPNLQISADNFFITRSYMYGGNCIYNATGSAGQHYNIGYCKFDGHSLVNGHSIKFDVPGSGNPPDYGHIYRNWFTSDADSYRGTDSGSQPSCLYAGEGKGSDGAASTPVDVNLNNVLFELNYAEFGRKNTLYLKHAMRVERNHLRKRSTGTDLSDGSHNVQSAAIGHNPGFRGGNVWYGTFCFNRLEGGDGVVLQGWNHDCVGNILSGTNLAIQISTKLNSTNLKALLGAEHAVVGGNDWSAAQPAVLGWARDVGGSYSYYHPEDLGWQSPPNIKLIGNTGGFVDDTGATVVFASGHPSGTYQWVKNPAGIDYAAAKPATIAGNGGRQGPVTYDLSTPVPDFSVNTARQVGPSATDGNQTWGAGGGGGPTLLPTDSTWATFWTVQKSAAGASVAQASDYLELVGVDPSLLSTDGAAIVSKLQFKAPFRADLDYMPLDTNSVTGGVYAQIYLLHGQGTAGSPTSSALLPSSTSPADGAYDPGPAAANALALGARASLDTKNPSSGSDQVRWRALDGTGTWPQIATSTAQTFAFPRNQWSRVSVTVQADQATVSVTFPDGSVVQQSYGGDGYISALVTAAAAGVNLALKVSNDRHARFRNVSVTTL